MEQKEKLENAKEWCNYYFMKKEELENRNLFLEILLALLSFITGFSTITAIIVIAKLLIK